MADEIELDGGEELPPGPFVKIYGSIIASSIWLESAATRLLWITMLAIADQDGNVRGSVRGLASIAKITPEECEAGLAVLESPDPDSRNPKHEGRRIKRLSGGWFIYNFREHREMRTPQQVKTADRVRRFRERQKGGDVTPNVTPVTRDAPVTGVTAVTVTTEVEGEVEGEVEKKIAVAEGDDLNNSTAFSTIWPDDAPLRLARMLNRGMGDNPAIGEVYNPIIATNGNSHEAAEQLKAAKVPIEFAEGWVYTFATAYKPRKVGDQINSVGYLVPRVIDAWERANAKTDASKASPPAVAVSTPGAQNVSRNGTGDLKGRGMLIFGELRSAVREIIVHNDPSDHGQGNRLERRIPDDALLKLDTPAQKALLAIGGARAIELATGDRVDNLSWRFAAAYAAANG